LQPTEQEYWQLISQGDKKAYEHVFKTYYQPLCHYCCSLLKDIDEAEEVVQTVFYNLWSKRESLQISSSIKSYVYRAVHNDSMNRIKHGKVKKMYAQDYKSSMGNSHSGTDVLEAKELSSRIHAAIDSLPEQCGHVFRLSRFENLKYSEIAEQLDISVKTVENHMGKALRLLREKLKDYLPAMAWLFFMIGNN
jgi:RNA polymerase sigma-70 factor (family 1)